MVFHVNNQAIRGSCQRVGNRSILTFVMKTMKKILSFGPNLKIYSLMLLLALAVALIPLLLLTKYAIPFFDDYGYSAPVWIHYMLGGFNPKGVISGSIENAVNLLHGLKSYDLRGTVLRNRACIFNPESGSLHVRIHLCFL